MITFLGLSFVVSLFVLLGAATMERSAIHGRINGANGLALLTGLIVSALASVVVAIIVTWLTRDGRMLFAVLAGSALYHWVIAKMLFGRLQALATQVAANDRANHPERYRQPQA